MHEPHRGSQRKKSMHPMPRARMATDKPKGRHRDRHDRFHSGQMIEPLALRGNENVADFIDHVFAASGYNARRLGEACKTYQEMIERGALIGLTVAGAMT